ncbi:TIGR04222 domain-containing membrane protein [Streptomyces ficellus]|uniref:TIGR04222 domain-containing membrane protein n=1 Tax=Streptomyces ficellus TaxID=1977088 RepID=A0ABT7YZ69_9ACTN|nr:TIGR04222 domain-containing membrane protein [Streptomyces ficellus]MDN3292507.1 TIGR04222 domain-containing membrane protein [Streptomyces ficellus]
MNIVAFLLYAAVAVSSVLLITGVVAARRGSAGPVHDRAEAAFLNGGPGRVVDAALASLHADGRVAVGGPGIVSVLRPVAHDPIERAVLHELAAAPSGALHTVRLAAMRNPAVQEAGDALAARGLLVPRATRRTWRRWSVSQGVTCLALFFASIVATVAEVVGYPFDDTPVPFIAKVAPALFVGGVVAIVCGSLASGRVTRAGRRAVTAYGREHAHFADPGHLVALHGLRALPDPVLREQLVTAARYPHHHPYQPQASGSAATTAAVVVWCAGSDPGGGGSGCGSGCGGRSGGGSGGGSGCGGGGGASCGGGGSSCGGGGGGGGSSCGGGGS